MPAETLDEFLATYNPNGERQVITIDVTPTSDSNVDSAFILIRHGEYSAIVVPMGMKDHLCLDVHPFVHGRDATAGAFGMSNGARTRFADTGTTSHGWPSMHLISVLVGEQGES